MTMIILGQIGDSTSSHRSDAPGGIMHKIISLLFLATLGGCTHHSSTPSPASMPIAPGFSAVRPGGTMKVGHLYFSGRGRYPAFYDAKGTLFSEFCWGDYAKDSVLSDLSRYVEEIPDPLAGYSGDAKGSASFGLPEILAAEASGGTDAKVTGIKRLTLNAEGAQVVLSSLGANCRAKIDEYSGPYEVVLLMAAQRADTMTLSARAKANLEVSLGKFIGLSPSSASGEANQALEYKMVFLSSNLGSTEPDKP